MCVIDLEPCEVWIPTRRRARKEHRCVACERIIRPGETYIHTFSKFEGDVDVAKHCLQCERDIEAFTKAHGSGPHPRGLIDILHECIEGAEPGEERRWKAMLRRVRARGAA